MNRKTDVLTFRIELRDVKPTIWRRIEVPARYSFWDLHVAIQDAMGWLDCHLHMFVLCDSTGIAEAKIGIVLPDLDIGMSDELAGWDVAVANYASAPGTIFRYDYDFGDGWTHDITLETISRRIKGERYPKCLDGEMACPPEDSGGPWRFAEIVKAVADESHPEHDDLVSWLPPDWRADDFDPAAVTFANPTTRWKKAFAGR